MRLHNGRAVYMGTNSVVYMIQNETANHWKTCAQANISAGAQRVFV